MFRVAKPPSQTTFRAVDPAKRAIRHKVKNCSRLWHAYHGAGCERSSTDERRRNKTNRRLKRLSAISKKTVQESPKENCGEAQPARSPSRKCRGPRQLVAQSTHHRCYSSCQCGLNGCTGKRSFTSCRRFPKNSERSQMTDPLRKSESEDGTIQAGGRRELCL